MRYIFLDTNNWIYLSNGFNILSNKHDELHFKVFDLLRKRTGDGSITILINGLIIEEWQRNKRHCKKQVEDLSRALGANEGTVKNIGKLIGGEGKDAAAMLVTHMQSFYQPKIARHEKHIDEVEQFLQNQTFVIEITDAVKVKASDQALQKKAPFIGDKKNSTADAVILLSSIEHIKTNCGVKPFGPGSATVFYPENYFVSSNSGDFS